MDGLIVWVLEAVRLCCIVLYREGLWIAIHGIEGGGFGRGGLRWGWI